MNLIKKLILGSRKFDVKYSDNYRDDHSINGQSDYDNQKILINKQDNTKSEHMEIVLVHEWLHMALMQVGESELSDNEDFVFKMGEKIHEFIIQVENK